MTANLRAMASQVRKANKKNAPGDTILAAITPAEAALLKAKGGSGRIDPKTGAKHFDAGGQRGGDGGGFNSGMGGGGGEGGGGGGGGNNGNYHDDNADRAARFSNPAERAAIANGDYKSAGGLSKDTGNDGQPLNYSREPDAPKTPMQKLLGFFQGTGSVIKGLGDLATGNLPGAALAGAAAYKSYKGMAPTPGKFEGNVPDTFNDPLTSTPPSAGDDSDNKGKGDPLAAAPKAPAPVVDAPPVTPVKDPLDTFTTLARKKWNYKSSMFGGGTGKTLLGQ
jgi:hypothetical protein